MPYRVEFTRAAFRASRKYPRPLRERIVTEASVLEENPLAGKSLAPPLDFLRSLRFSWKGTSYRIAYSLKPKDELVLIHLVAPRQNFYKRLRQILGL